MLAAQSCFRPWRDISGGKNMDLHKKWLNRWDQDGRVGRALTYFLPLSMRITWRLAEKVFHNKRCSDEVTMRWARGTETWSSQHLQSQVSDPQMGGIAQQQKSCPRRKGSEPNIRLCSWGLLHKEDRPRMSPFENYQRLRSGESEGYRKQSPHS